MNNPSRTAVITGLGTLSAAGAGRAALEAQLAHSRPEATVVADAPEDREGEVRRSPRLAAQIGAQDLSPWLSPRAARRMSRPSKFAVVAAQLAVEDSGLEPDTLHADPVSVVMATSFGPTDYSYRILESIYDEGPEATSPSLFTESVANAPAAQVALAFRAHGPNITITQREAGPLQALACAAREVVEGRSPVALAGSVDEVAPILHSALERFGALSGCRGGDPGLPRPFDARRDGFLLAEGATVVVIESEERARERGATILARVRTTIAGFDPEAPVTGWSSSGARLGRRLASRLAAAGIEPSAIDRIVSGASGSRAGDRLEGAVLSSVWNGAAMPPVLAPKGVTGECGGGALAAAVLAASGALTGPTSGFEREDPAIGIRPHDGAPLEPPTRTLVSALAVGGAATWTVLERAEG